MERLGGFYRGKNTNFFHIYYRFEKTLADIEKMPYFCSVNSRQPLVFKLSGVIFVKHHLDSQQPLNFKLSGLFFNVRLSSEGANNLLLQQYSSWTILTPI